MLAANLYELEVQKRNAERDALEANKSDIGWGSQIRNYVLDQSRIKDLRTGIERSDTQKVLDGDLDELVEASLKSGLEAGSKRSDEIGSGSGRERGGRDGKISGVAGSLKKK